MTDEELDEFKSFHGLDCATKDEWWAHAFLAGYVWPRLIVKDKVEKRKVQIQFLQGGKREAKAREAWVRIPGSIATGMPPGTLSKTWWPRGIEREAAAATALPAAPA